MSQIFLAIAARATDVLQCFSLVRQDRGERGEQTLLQGNGTSDFENRCIGAFVGLACSDALGTTLEFKSPGSLKPISDMVGGGPFNLEPGYWTDDTSMALCLAMSFIETGRCDPTRQMQLYERWRDDGYMSSTGQCFDIGNTVNAAIEAFQRSGDPLTCALTNEWSSGNGALMRLAPVMIFNVDDLDMARQDAYLSTITTHGSDLCIQASDYFAVLLWRAMNGFSKADILDADEMKEILGFDRLRPEIKDLVEGGFKHRQPPNIRGTGFVVQALEAALWAFHHAEDFESGALAAANLGDDADTTAAIYGQLAGAYFGVRGIPMKWRNRLADGKRLWAVAEALHSTPRR